MTVHTWVLLLSFSIGRPGLAAVPPEQQILMLEQEADRIRAADRPVDDLTAEDYVGIGVGGTVYDKRGSAPLYTSGRVRTSSLTVTDRKIRVYGDTAVVTGTRHIEDVMDGVARSELHRFTRVWVRRRGRWLIVSFQATRVAPGPSPT